ncbi:phospholipase [Kribbella sandramycini]|nr:phospholipase [Kribbella sandramycini]MBB6566810.1 dienelactone hydrolase [Kribbella sandramycini]
MDTRYDDLVDHVEAQYGEGRYAEALTALDAADLPAHAAELAHLRACLLGASGDPAAALATLQSAAAAGAWWRPEILEDDDLEALQANPDFRHLVATSAERATDDPTPARITLPAVPSVGVVVALHGAGQGAEHARRDWAGVLELGYALVCVESSRRMSPMYRTWPDPAQAAADIARALAGLPAELAGLPVVAAGFSAGGRVALNWAFTAEPSPASGVLALAPALRELPASAANKLSPATIWIGTDDDLLEVVDAAADALTGFGCEIERVPGLGHAFPADLADRLAAKL